MKEYEEIYPNRKSKDSEPKAKPSICKLLSPEKERLRLLGREMGKIYTNPATRDQWWIKTAGPNAVTTFTLHGPKGEVRSPSHSYTLYDLPQHMAEGFLADKETHLRDPIPVTKDWVLDQILAKEAKGIDCGIERQMAKQYFSEPQFTPKRALSPTEAAKPKDTWDIPF